MQLSWPGGHARLASTGLSLAMCRTQWRAPAASHPCADARTCAALPGAKHRACARCRAPSRTHTHMCCVREHAGRACTWRMRSRLLKRARAALAPPARYDFQLYSGLSNTISNVFFRKATPLRRWACSTRGLCGRAGRTMGLALWRACAGDVRTLAAAAPPCSKRLRAHHLEPGIELLDGVYAGVCHAARRRHHLW